MVALHERYLACCDDRRLDELGEFVSEHVSGSAPVDGGTGTSSAVAPTGRAITVQELVVHRIVDGRIAHCWGICAPSPATCSRRPDRRHVGHRHQVSRRSQDHG
jgi:predicted ester cyclase